MSTTGLGRSREPATDSRLFIEVESGPPHVSAESVRAELEKILSSHIFLTSERLSKFLRYVVEGSIRGQTDALKESILGMRVFGRGESFDPRVDAIVRVEAGRLRARLAAYYQTTGAGDPVRIEINKGGYVPAFHRRDSFPAEAGSLAGYPFARNDAGIQPPNPAAAVTSIVVLPFVNLSAEPENEYFSDGLTEDVIAVLTRIPGIRVIARSTAFRYKGMALDIRKIGEELHVGLALEGSVRRIGDRLRITAQLIDTPSCFHIWSRTYDREMKDIFAIQRDISEAIGGMVQGQFHSSQFHSFRAPLTSDSPDAVKAYDLYLRGIWFENKRSAEGLAKGLEYLRQAADMDSRCAPVFARLASSYTLQAAHGLELPAVVMPRARDAAARALEIDDSLALAHTAKGCVSALYDFDWVTAERDFRRGLELNSGVPEVHHRYAFFYLSPQGRGEESLWHIQQAKNLDPMSLILHAAECAVLGWSRQYEAAIACGRKTLELERSYYPGYMYLSWAYRQYGMIPEALAAGEESVRLSQGNPLALGGLGVTYAVAGKMDAARRVIDEMQQRPCVPSTAIAYVCAAMGEIGQALAWLERGHREKWPAMVYLRIASWDERLRADPRFEAIAKNVGL